MIRKGICIVLLAVLLSLRACAYSEHKRPQKAEYEQYKASDQVIKTCLLLYFALPRNVLVWEGLGSPISCRVHEPENGVRETF
jgi:hypothetical protein